MSPAKVLSFPRSPRNRGAEEREFLPAALEIIDTPASPAGRRTALAIAAAAPADAGTHEDLLAAGEYVRTVEMRQGLKIACVEEVAYNMGFIGRDRLLAEAERFSKSEYGRYLRSLFE